MINNSIKRKPGFQKGISPNPSGRPKGALSESTKQYLHLKSLATNDYEKAYKILWEKVEAGESWAHQLFFKDLVPKKLNQPTIFIEPTDETTDTQITSLRKGLAQFTEHTEDTLISSLKALNGIKINETINTQTNAIRDTREELMEKVTNIAKVIDHIKTTPREK